MEIAVNTLEKIIKVEEGSIVSPIGFQAASIHAGLKRNKKDLGLIVSDVPAHAAAVYTMNHFRAAPLKVTKMSIENEGKLQAIVCNSGNANACTGEQGIENAYMMQEAVATKLSLPDHYVGVASTGVIGEQLPIEKILNGVEAMQLSTNLSSGKGFSEAILTTDLVEKSVCYKAEINGKEVTLAATAKGSGMIHPNMATMLGFVTTDIAVEQVSLQRGLRQAVDETFNCITVDGDTSTNDMVIVMANGEAQNETLNEVHPEWNIFYMMLKQACEEMAKAIARDGEGATKLIEVQVHGATNDAEASEVAKQIVGSSLVKSMVYGADANWGRVICAIGYSNAQIIPEKVDVLLGDVQMLVGGEPIQYLEEDATAQLKEEMVVIKVNLNLGAGKAKAWGCDLTYDYVRINASYRT
ncbi:bifunctional ornithine acetyltransferase/N-acetylglutamate synthase [Bacillus solimangrovi]|uniref:Arginine biosynthesis bifunctional protein ArgJ n=1 Tax=Bacillus solimangrovi TaxID=1305675 RepID=A0A1E5LC29_9BACI|nr:bifunctional ornithine acetyltransferase/N-acetylglutamate synthase [Bacillus solimangrovi]OEH91644.1 bifunctional ornithine acetyltransferase/N-acetylglutamate synthase [Bacillus solimangrovi]